MNNDNKKSSFSWVVLGGIALIVILILVGYRISGVSVGPVTVHLDKPQNNNSLATSAPIYTSLPMNQNPTSGPVQAAPDIDTNPFLELPFSDGFDTGVSQLWRIVEGTPLITNGKLAGSDSVTLEVGNNSLSQYIVQFDVYGTDNCTWGYDNYLAIGVSPYLQYRAAYTDMIGRGQWYAFQNNQWKVVTRDENGVGCDAKVKIVVNGNSYKIYANGKISSEIIYGSSSGAPFSIGVGKYPLLDNLSITHP